jgi:CheY-like chemotaxis protein
VAYFQNRLKQSLGIERIAGGADFAVCVIDYLMPEMDGLELARAIRQEKGPATPPLILFSASTPSGADFRQKVAGVVSSGEEAARACFAEHYDVVLMDIEMPDMDGIAATALIRQKLPKALQPYVVALTANAMARERERYLRSGMDDYLSKPLDVAALTASLRAATEFLADRGSGVWAHEMGDGIG